MKLLLLIAATINITQSWWIFDNFCSWCSRYPFLRHASWSARKEFRAIKYNDTLTRGQREDALQSWAAKHNLLDSYNSYKNITDLARAKKFAAISDTLKNLPQVFRQLEEIQTDLNLTNAGERTAIQKLCLSIDPQQRAAVNFLLRLYSSTQHVGKYRSGREAMDEVDEEVYKIFERFGNLVRAL
ncbi:hypothetical protein KIN20_000254 [Parelaphostrongylus tenuis]|nr:hypothetical protein KIN20_000254 [Parelaphostrongylus tenuis]